MIGVCRSFNLQRDQDGNASARTTSSTNFNIVSLTQHDESTNYRRPDSSLGIRAAQASQTNGKHRNPRPGVFPITFETSPPISSSSSTTNVAQPHGSLTPSARPLYQPPQTPKVLPHPHPQNHYPPPTSSRPQ